MSLSDHRTSSTHLLSTHLLSILLLATLLMLFVQGPADAGPRPLPPTGYERFIVYVADGAYDFTQPHPVVPGCFFAACDGRYFYEQIMGWDEAQILDEEIAAKDFFWQRFGIDVDAPENAGRVELRSIYADPRIDYRVVHHSGFRVPADGWPVHDGALTLFVVDPEGYELGGDFVGLHVPVGTFMSFGIYRFQPARRNGRPIGEPVTLRFQAVSPLFLQADNSFHLRCELEHDEWGSGIAQGVAITLPLDDGRYRFEARNVLTFASDN